MVALYAARGREISLERAADEVAADKAGQLLENGELLDDFIRKHREDRTLLEKVRDAIRSLIAKLTGAEKRKAQTAEGKLAAALGRLYETVARETAEGKNTVAEQGGKDYTEAEGKTNKGAAEAWEDDYDGDDLPFVFGEESAPETVKTTEKADSKAADPRKSYQAREELRQAAEKTLGQSGQRAILGAYETGQDTAEYYAGFSAYYQAAMDGKAQETVKGDYAAKLTPAQRMAAYTAGQNDAQSARKTEATAGGYAAEGGEAVGLVYDEFVRQAVSSGRRMTDSEGNRRVYLTARDAQRINDTAKALGVRVRFVDEVEGGQVNAQIQGGEVLIEKDNPNPIMFLVGHEMTHRMQELAPEEYRAFRDTLEAEDKSWSEKVNAVVALYAARGWEISLERAADEVAADKAGQLLENGELLDDFIRKHREDRTLLEKVRDAIRSLIAKLTGAEKRKAQTAEGKLAAALEAASKAAGTKTGTEDGTPRNHLKSRPRAARGRSIELETMENNRFQRLRQFHDDLPGEWYAFTGDYFYLYSNQSFTDYTILAKTKINQENRADIEWFIKEVQNGTFTGAEAFNRWTSSFQRGKGRDYWYRIDPSKPGTAGRHDGVDVRERGSQHGGGSEKNGGTGEVKFSLKSPIEETKNLLAVHNKDEKSILATPEYSSIQAVKADSGRLGQVDSGGYDGLLKAMDEQIGNIITKIKQGNKGRSDNSFMESDIIGEVLLDAAKGKKTVDAIMKAFAKEGYKISSQTAQDIQAVYKAAAEMPVGYFEAKPQRAVGFEEVLAAVIPSDSSEKLRTGLERAGVRTVEYEPGNEADRLEKVNGVEGARFSLKGGYKKVGKQAWSQVQRERMSRYGGEFDHMPRVDLFFANDRLFVVENQDESGFGVIDWVDPGKNQAKARFVWEVMKHGGFGDTESYRRTAELYRSKAGNEGGNSVYAGNAGAGEGNAGLYAGKGRATDAGSVADENFGNHGENRNSLKGTTITRNYEALVEENRLLKEQVAGYAALKKKALDLTKDRDYWKSQTRLTKGFATDYKAVERAAKSLVKEYGATIEAGDIQKPLQKLYDYLARGYDETGPVDSGEAWQRARDIARELVENAVEADEEYYEQYAGLRKYLRYSISPAFGEKKKSERLPLPLRLLGLAERRYSLC